MIKKRILEQVEQLKASQPYLNGLVTLIDPSEQLNELLDKDTTLPLYGQGVILKDNVSTKDILTSASSRILENYVPVFDATIVKKLKDAGAIILGKSTMDELAMGGTGLTPASGPTHNPYDLDRISGGSSSGSAAIAGANLVDFAIGSDTGDSVRKPAAYCGVVGVKPTYGRISRYGVIPYASSLDHVGYFTQDVMQSAKLLEILAGRDDLDVTSANESVDNYSSIEGNLKNKRIGILMNVMDTIDDSLKAPFNDLIEKMKHDGVEIVEKRMNQELLDTLFATYYVIANCEATANHASLDGIRYGVRHEGKTLSETMKLSREHGFGSLVKRRFVVGAYGLEDDNQQEVFRKAQRVRRLIVEDLKETLKDIDALMVLAAPDVAPKFEDVKKRNYSIVADNHMVLGNFSGYPSMTVPFDFVDGMPIGVNLTSLAFEEKLMFDIALGIEKLVEFNELRKERLPQWLMK